MDPDLGLGLVLPEQLAPLSVEHRVDPPLPEERVPVPVVVEVARGDRPGHERRAQQELLEAMELAPVNLLLAPARERVLVPVEAPVHVRNVEPLNHDLARVADA